VPEAKGGQIIPKHWTLEQRNAYGKAIQGDEWLMPTPTPNFQLPKVSEKHF